LEFGTRQRLGLIGRFPFALGDYRFQTEAVEGELMRAAFGSRSGYALSLAIN
tara:strand:- start:308 stop:463 length:156 start_codon:yes stop_codon:yes gene_type:complete